MGDIVYVGTAAHRFFTDQPGRFGLAEPVAGFGPAEPDAGPDLMSVLPWASAGYFMQSGDDELMEIYSRQNHLFDPNDRAFIIPDEYFRTYFGGDIPATFYGYRDNQGQLQRVLMGDAVNDGMIDHELNTFELLQRLHPGQNQPAPWAGFMDPDFNLGFNPDRFHFRYLEDILFFNSLSRRYIRNHRNFPNYQEIFNNMRSRNVYEAIAAEKDTIARALQGQAQWQWG